MGLRNKNDMFDYRYDTIRLGVGNILNFSVFLAVVAVSLNYL